MKKLFITLVFILLVLINYPSFADFPIRQSINWDGGSVIVYNSTDHEYLAVWVEAIPVLSGYLQQIKGQRIAEDGSMLGTVFTIFNVGTLPSIAYNEKINEYIVVGCNTELYGQRVSSTGTLIGSQIKYTTTAANSRILYNSLAGTYLLIGVEIPPSNQLFTRKIGADGQPLGAIQNLGMNGEFAAAYAPISSPETPYGRYLLFTGMPYLLDSDGNLLYTITDQHGVKHPGIPFSWGIGEHYAFDVAYGGSTFLAVWADKAHFSQALKDIRCESSGIWGSFIDPYKLDYTSDYIIQDKSFPITRICDHQETNDANGEFIASWNPKVIYSSPGQKFMVTWRETPMSFNYNDATVNHIRANTVSGAIPPSVNTVISVTNGNENPKNPVIAASTLNPNALIIWEDARDSASANINIYGNLFSIPAAPSITVVQPNGGENWKISSKHEIKWTCKNFTASVKIEYSTDGGSTYTSISNSTANDGSYMWTVPNKPSEYCLIRIKDASDGDPVDISDAVFTISGKVKTVSNTNDSGPGSFRQAIIDANANPGKDTIVFNIPGTGSHTIQPLSQLPGITDPVIIDGYTQPGSSPNTNSITSGSNAVLKIELDGSSTTGASGTPCGLFIESDSCVVRGLGINRFPCHGIVLSSQNNVIEGNFIGTDITGTTAFKNGWSGIIIFGGRNIIGGVIPESRNIISGNYHCGIIIDINGNNNVVEGNYIGTKIDGSSPLGNGESGVLIHSRNNFSNIIGGQTPESENIIAFNKNGVYIYESYQDGSILYSYNNKIFINSIHNNNQLGITLGGGPEAAANDFGDIDIGPNNLQNYPILTEVEDDDITFVSLYLNSKPNTKYRIDFYSNSEGDPSGYGEGERFIGFTEITTGSNGYVSSNVSLGTKVLSNHFLTATATDPDGNTSEFSNSIPVAPNTPDGLKIQTIIGSIFNLLFDNVTGSGYTTAVTYTGGAPVPENLIPLPAGSPDYYSISTTADFSGNIEIGIRYSDSSLSEAQESNLGLNVYESGEWKDITSFVDTDSNIIHGITSHLSDFIIALPSSGPLNILVTSTADTGVGSLRHALQLAEENPGTDTILFSIPLSDTGYNSSLGIWTLRPSTTYYIPNYTVIDGRIFTAPDTSKPGIEIDGTILKQSGMTGIWLCERAEIHGLIVNNCQYGVWIAGPNAKVENCFIGTDPSGDFSKPNGLDGILVTDGSTNLVIQNNLISGNHSNGIRLAGENTSRDTIRKNIIGTNLTGAKALPNGYDGINVHAGANGNIIEQNFISGNIQCGIHLTDSATNCNIIRENTIGTNADGSEPIPNGTFGIALFNGPTCNIIGPDNFIAYNTDCGVLIDGSDISVGTVGNTITANRITCNGSKGIHNYRGGNTELLPPVINSITNYLVSGTALPGERIELFIDESDEGFFFLGADTADGSGNFSYQLPVQLPSLPNIVVTATDTAGNTSEFSQPYKITSVQVENIIPSAYKLCQNYPNPFNPVTAIRYEVPERTNILIRVINILGEEVLSLIDEEKPAGIYFVKWNGNDQNGLQVSSGIYFLQMISDHFSGIKKMILLR